ncbi:MAG: glycosyltransferase family 4 protein [Thermoanaerobaculia bacterium]
MRVLYVDAVGPFGGASRSLYEMVKRLPAMGVEPYFVMQAGTAQHYYGEVAKDIVAVKGLSRFDNTAYSYYRGLRWLVALREVAWLPFTVWAILEARRRWKSVDLIHVNEIVDIIPGLLAKAAFHAPMVVHVRSPQRAAGKALRSRWLEGRLRHSVAATVAINENTRATLPADLPVKVIQNSFTPRHADSPDEGLARRLGALRGSSLKVGFVGNLHESKGILDLVDAAKLVRASGRDVEFVVAGGGTGREKGLAHTVRRALGLAQDAGDRVRERIRDYGLDEDFHLLGPTRDIQVVYEAIDVICFPSHFNAPGRPVFEAAFSGVPSIVCVEQPMQDTFVHGETGLSVPSRSPELLAAAIGRFADDRREVARMGASARRLAEANFVAEENARRLMRVYESVLAENPTGAPAVPAGRK